MIQRIQTLFLLGIVVCMLVAISSDFITVNTTEGTYILKSYVIQKVVNGEVSSYKSSIFILLVMMLSVIAAVISIFQYKNRLLQIKIGALNSLIIAVSFALIWFYTDELSKEITNTVSVNYGIGFWIPLAALVCNFFSNWFIRRDESLVRDSERLR